MDTDRIVFLIVMGWTLIIHGGLTYLIVKKKEYGLISGFGTRPEEEKEYLRNSGYIEVLGKVLKITFYLLVLTVLMAFLPISYGFEIGLGLFLLVLMVGIVWNQRYEVPRKRKKMLWISGIVSVVTLLLVFGLMLLGFIENKVTIKNNTFIVSGIYGVEWEMKEIEGVELLEEMPEVIVKSNGFASAGHLKGRFRLEAPYEGAILFVTVGNPPYLYVKTRDDDLLLNRENSEETIKIYRQLKKAD
ncbi:DUF3784 domain-containing protein [Thalassobacillus pellis]|uniref:DUF3784 domain-containing protein n=1 Tax=Thalassobacillus pellis TaxID=748008 RepID=UPI001961E440|nr:DUF3784 domain-containing protein [Thalassobacillus pellis]MBM7553574.1 hypothetical protein [Thalassobacillus pellis]